MSGMMPIIATTLSAKPELAGKIMLGLTNGTYERIGGVIRRSDNKRIVAWLRDMADGQSVGAPVLSGFGPMLQLSAAASVLNLSISAIGFIEVRKRLVSIEDKLESLSSILAGINRRLDLGYYANFRAALELAQMAFGMRDDANKRISATQAINRFLEAEHLYLGFLDDELKAGSPAVPLLLSTLILAYVSTARCYLELGETNTAWMHFQEGDTALSSRVKEYYASIVDINPAIFLHPALADTISLERLTRIMQYYDRSLTETSVFETLRKPFWETARRSPDTWLRKFPAYIWNHDMDGWEKKGMRRRQRNWEEMIQQVLPRLPEAFEQVELAQETLGCIQGYSIELRYLLDNHIEFPVWQQIELPTASQDEHIAVLLPENSVLLED